MQPGPQHPRRLRATRHPPTRSTRPHPPAPNPCPHHPGRPTPPRRPCGTTHHHKLRPQHNRSSTPTTTFPTTRTTMDLGPPSTSETMPLRPLHHTTLLRPEQIRSDQTHPRTPPAKQSTPQGMDHIHRTAPMPTPSMPFHILQSRSPLNTRNERAPKTNQPHP
jgi:hypothetical protein